MTKAEMVDEWFYVAGPYDHVSYFSDEGNNKASLRWEIRHTDRVDVEGLYVSITTEISVSKEIPYEEWAENLWKEFKKK